MCNVLPDLVLELLSFICFPLNNDIFFTKCSDFIQLLCTFSRLNFSRLNFTAELPTNLVYKIIVVVMIIYIYLICCFSL